MRTREVDQFLDVVHRQAARDRDRVRHVSRESDGSEIFQRVVWNLRAHQCGAGHHAARSGEQQRVTVGHRFRAEVVAYRRRRAAAVVDHHRLSECLGEYRRARAPRVVGARPRRVRNDEPYRPVRVGRLISCIAARGGKQDKRECYSDTGAPIIGPAMRTYSFRHCDFLLRILYAFRRTRTR